MSAENENDENELEIPEIDESGDEEQEESGSQYPQDGTKYVEYFDGTEIFATISETFELHNGSATVQLRCDWDKRHDVVALFLEGGANSTPAKFPFWQIPSGSPLVASSVRIEPMQTTYKGDGQAIEYKYALITLTYQMQATEMNVESTNQYLTLYPDGIYWNVNGTYEPLKQEEAPGVRFPTYDIVLTHPHMKSVTEDGEIQEYEGYVNSDRIFIRYNGVAREFAPQTLMCTAPSIRAGVNLFGSGFNTISLRLSYNPVTHNAFFNPRVGSDDKTLKIENHTSFMYVKDGAGYKQINLFPEREFVPLFRAFGIYAEGGGDGGDSTPDDSSGGSDNNGGGGTPTPADLGIDDGYHTGSDGEGE